MASEAGWLAVEGSYLLRTSEVERGCTGIVASIAVAYGRRF